MPEEFYGNYIYIKNLIYLLKIRKTKKEANNLIALICYLGPLKL